MLYFQPMTTIQRIYYEYHATHGRGANMFPYIDDPNLHYLSRYVLTKEFHRELHPFSFLRKDHNVVMVGVHDGFIELGYSMLFITASLISPVGRVWALDIDKRNVDAVQNYAERFEVRNARAFQKGIWNEKGEKEFLFFKDYTSSNMVSSSVESRTEMLEKKWGSERLREKTFREVVPVNTLDAILEEEGISEPIHYLNVAVNGAELQVIEGAQRLLLSKDLEVISFPYRYTTFNVAAYLQDLGFKILVAEGNTKSWEEEPFYFACAVKMNEEEIRDRGFVPVEITPNSDVDWGFDLALKEGAIDQ